LPLGLKRRLTLVDSFHVETRNQPDMQPTPDRCFMDGKVTGLWHNIYYIVSYIDLCPFEDWEASGDREDIELYISAPV